MKGEEKKSKRLFMEKCKEFLHSDNYEKLSEVSLVNKGVEPGKLGETFDQFREGLKLFVGHLKQAKSKVT